MKTFQPLISVIIPVHNGQVFIRIAINSLLQQSYKNAEILVINDGSSDNSSVIAKSFGKKIRYYEKKNGGVASALNFGIKKAEGDYISWLSHDDYYYPDKVKKQIEFLASLPEIKRKKTILYSNYEFIDSKNGITQKIILEEKYSKKQLSDSFFSLFKAQINGCSLLIPKKCFEEVGLFDERLRHTQDYDLWFRMFPKYNLFHIPEILVQYRIHDQQSSSTNIDAIIEGDELWTKMYKGITNKERVMIGGTLENFYTSSFNHMLMAKHFRTAQYLANSCKKRFPYAYETCMSHLKKYMNMEQSAREFEVLRQSKIFKVWKIYDTFKKTMRGTLKKI